MESPDDDWQPPSEAEMKVIEARRERQNKISALIGEYLLKGYKMLATTCPVCYAILLQKKEHGQLVPGEYCVSCNELDTETAKDNPAMSDVAALSQVQEQFSRAGGQPLRLNTVNLPSTSFVSPSPPSPPPNSQPWEMGSDSAAPDVLYAKINWATQKLHETTSVQDSIDLCQLIDAAACALDGWKSIPTSALEVESDSTTPDELYAKINWAAQKLHGTTSVQDSTSLCRLISAAALAVGAWKRIPTSDDME